MTDLFVVDFSGGAEERARREAERNAEHGRLRDRYTLHLVERADLDEAAARRAVTALFDPHDGEGARCECGCHPRLSSTHGDGFDCRCTWDAARRAAEARRWEEYWDSDEAAELRQEDRREEQAITAWLTGQSGVEASRTTSMAPEQWEGTIDGHSFYFRERGGCWRIEVDLRENGRFMQRLVRVAEDGGLVTEPVPIMDGEVIAQGADSQFGATATEHIAFIVRTVRDHLRRAQCGHPGAALFCPRCGHRTTEAS